MIDRTAKILLFLIAAGLWANVLLKPAARAANARQDYTHVLGSIAGNVADIASGVCTNQKIC